MQLTYRQADLGFSLDLRQARIDPDALAALREPLAAAHREMAALEAGKVMNRDEYRQVTHFTDRQAYVGGELFADVEAFFARVRGGDLVSAAGKPFDAVVVNGIGGSALGPQLMQFAMNGPYWNELPRAARAGNPRLYFTDNTDAAGFVDVMAVIDPEATLVVTISKSGGTRETLNNMVAFEQAWAARGLDFAAYAAAITMPGSKLDKYAREAGWLNIWAMAESIGGRTSETAVVGHVPAAAAGIDFAAFLDGALTMDEWTRQPELGANPAYLLAAVWYVLGNGRGDRNMVIVPYADRLVLLSRYLQQLVMESLGKERDRDGVIVNQGLNVFGNKGGTDAHAFIQQLNDGRNDFFVTFIEVLEDAEVLEVDGAMSMGDYLHNFLQGLSNALYSKQRAVLRLTVERLDARALGMLVALYERAVAVYAELVNVNAFHQPGVEAYKKVSDYVNALTRRVQTFVGATPGFSGTAADLATAIDRVGLGVEVEGILAKMAVNGRRFNGHGLRRTLEDGRWRYTIR